jgi:hypothetical protein
LRLLNQPLLALILMNDPFDGIGVVNNIRRASVGAGLNDRLRIGVTIEVAEGRFVNACSPADVFRCLNCVVRLLGFGSRARWQGCLVGAKSDE